MTVAVAEAEAPAKIKDKIAVETKLGVESKTVYEQVRALNRTRERRREKLVTS